MSKQISLIFGGDLCVGEEPEKYFKGIDKILTEADVRMAQLETPYAKEASEYIPEDRTWKNLDPLIGRFELMTLPGNHFYDFGEVGVNDTVEWLDMHGIAHSGGGANIELAKKPAFCEKDGVRFGVLSYNAVGRKKCFAGKDKGGCAYINFIRAEIPVDMLEQDFTDLQQDNFDLKKPLHADYDVMRRDFIDPKSYLSMQDDINAIRDKCDVLIVYFHKGYVHQTAVLADYESLLSRVALDAGADVVFSSHSHLLRGVEMYKGKAIYHGLNNFIMWVPGLSPLYKKKRVESISGDSREWVEKRVERFGFVPDPEYPTYPFHPDSIYCYTAKCIITDGKITEYRLIPMLVEKDGIPYVHGHDEKGLAVMEYVEKITKQAGLNARYKWDGDEVVIY